MVRQGSARAFGEAIRDGKIVAFVGTNAVNHILETSGAVEFDGQPATPRVVLRTLSPGPAPVNQKEPERSEQSHEFRAGEDRRPRHDRFIEDRRENEPVDRGVL